MKPTFPWSVLFGASYDEFCARQDLLSLEAERRRLDYSIGCATAKYASFLNKRLAFAANLPAELLTAIFEIVCAHTPRTIHMERRLSHVCSNWRAVAINTSSLWTNITVLAANPTDYLETYLERSSLRTLDIVIDLRNYQQCFQWVIGDILERLDDGYAFKRCRSLGIIAESNPLKTIYPALERLRGHSMPLLETLDINLEYFYSSHQTFIPPPNITILSGGAPRFSTLHLHGCSLHTHLPPLTGLTTLSIHCLMFQTLWTFEMYRQFLEQLVSLERLSLCGDPISLTDVDYDGTIFLPSLRELRLRDDAGAYFPTLLKNAVAPSLQKLHLIKCDGYTVIELHERYLGASAFSSLEHLVIEDPYFYASIIERLCVVLSSVKHVTFINKLKVACYALSRPNLWPGIQTVRLWADTNADMNIRRLRKILADRKSEDCSIPNLWIANKPPLFPEWLLRPYSPSLQLIEERPARWPDWVTL